MARDVKFPTKIVLYHVYDREGWILEFDGIRYYLTGQAFSEVVRCALSLTHSGFGDPEVDSKVVH